MTYIYYANKFNTAGKILHKKLCSAFHKSWMKRYHTVAGLAKKLHGPILHDISAAVVLIDSRRELDEILLLKNILWDIKLIVIYSTEADISQKEILALRPRFFTWTDTDLSQAVEVLGNVIRRQTAKRLP